MNTPRPVSVYISDSTTYKVYRVKNQFEDNWPDESLKKLVLLCRSSYLNYGHRPLLDDHDSKAAIYLVSVEYNVNGSHVTEWLSIRMVPGQGLPEGVLEPELYYLNDERLDQYMKNNVFGGSDNFWESIVSSSRMCGIKPQTMSGGNIWPRNRFTAQSFALIHKQYFEDYQVSYTHITAIIGDDFIHKVLTIRSGNRSAHPLFTRAAETLNVREDKIRLDRSVYAYKFPTYWFSAPDLLKLIEDLVTSGYFTGETLRHYFGVEDVSLIGAEDLKILSELFFSKENIVGGSVRGPDLRMIAEQKLKERPRLRIIPAVKWNIAIDKMIKVGRLSKI